MRSTKKQPARKANGAPKLKRSQKDFYKILGSLGGTATKAAKPEGYFSDLAKHSHEVRKRRAAELAAQTESCSA